MNAETSPALIWAPCDPMNMYVCVNLFKSCQIYINVNKKHLALQYYCNTNLNHLKKGKIKIVTNH